jgi:hypothetical protein
MKCSANLFFPSPVIHRTSVRKYQIALGSLSYDAKGPFAAFACFLNPVNSGRKHTKEI